MQANLDHWTMKNQVGSRDRARATYSELFVLATCRHMSTMEVKINVISIRKMLALNKASR